jgi:asparagine synthase (glutamine-hydrolysing)
VPFLDHRLTEISAHLPQQAKIHGGVGKYPLKYGARGLLPEEILFDKKKGFGAPVDQWLKGPFGEVVMEVILRNKYLKSGLFDFDFIKSLLQSHKSGTNHSLQIWTLFILASWHERFFGE